HFEIRSPSATSHNPNVPPQSGPAGSRITTAVSALSPVLTVLQVQRTHALFARHLGEAKPYKGPAVGCGNPPVHRRPRLVDQTLRVAGFSLSISDHVVGRISSTASPNASGVCLRHSERDF